MQGLGDDETLKAAVSKTLEMPSASDAERTEQRVHPSLRTIQSLLLLSSGTHDGVTVERGGKMSEWEEERGWKRREQRRGGKGRRGERRILHGKKRSSLRAKNAHTVAFPEGLRKEGDRNPGVSDIWYRNCVCQHLELATHRHSGCRLCRL